MAFVISQTQSYRWPVTISQLREDGGIVKRTVHFRFRKLTADALLDYEQRDTDLSRFADAIEQANGDRDLAMILVAAAEQAAGRAVRRSADKAMDLMEILEGWEDVADADGPLEFNEANLALLLNAEPTAYPALREAFREANRGHATAKGSEARRKNS